MQRVTFTNDTQTGIQDLNRQRPIALQSAQKPLTPRGLVVPMVIELVDEQTTAPRTGRSTLLRAGSRRMAAYTTPTAH